MRRSAAIRSGRNADGVIIGDLPDEKVRPFLFSSGTWADELCAPFIAEFKLACFPRSEVRVDRQVGDRSRILGPRGAQLQIPYANRDIPNSLFFQGWRSIDIIRNATDRQEPPVSYDYFRAGAIYSTWRDISKALCGLGVDPAIFWAAR